MADEASFKLAVRRARDLESELESKLSEFPKLATARVSDQRICGVQIDSALTEVCDWCAKRREKSAASHVR